MTVIAAIPALIQHVRALPRELYTCREVANALEISPSTVRRLAVAYQAFSPTETVTWGAKEVSVFDKETVTRLHAHVAEHRSPRGQPRLWTDTERRERRAAYSASGYRRRQANVLHERGDAAGAAVLLDDAARRLDALRGQRRERARSAPILLE